MFGAKRRSKRWAACSGTDSTRRWISEGCGACEEEEEVVVSVEATVVEGRVADACGIEVGKGMVVELWLG